LLKLLRKILHNVITKIVFSAEKRDNRKELYQIKKIFSLKT